jgi:hypothetical protein
MAGQIDKDGVRIKLGILPLSAIRRIDRHGWEAKVGGKGGI